MSDFFGGSIEKSKLYEFGYEISIVQLKRSKLSNVLPLGCIKKGLYRERALLFKLICDQIFIPVSLEQGIGLYIVFHKSLRNCDIVT